MPISHHAKFLIPTLAAMIGSEAAAVTVPVVNPSFESPALNLCSFGPPITGWTVASGGVWRPGSGGQCLGSYPGGPPDGSQIAFTNGGDIEQVLTTNLTANTRYLLRVKVGRRADCCQATNYRVQLRAASTLLFEDPGLLSLTPGTFKESIVNFATGPSHPQLGQPLRIRLVQSTTGQANYDQVRLESFPADCNANGVLDSVDIANGTPDVNGNGVPDSCEVIPCPSDIAPQPSGNGTVNVDDLLAVINDWGPCSACPADIAPPGGNGTVNVDDLLAIINGWGACP